MAATKAEERARALRPTESVTSAITTRAAHTLCYGLAGTALLHACLGDANTAAHHWNAASRALGDAPSDGVHTGPGALATSLIIGTAHLPDRGPHHALVPRATGWLSARAQALARHQQTSPHPWTPWAVYDAIKGLSGIGRILLAAHTTGHHTDAATGLRAALTTLTGMILTDQGTRPGWWLPAHAHPPTVRVPPSGAATTGMAHGIAGPLAFLALAQRAGHTVPGQHDAIAKAAHWLLTWAGPGPTWPPHISGTDLDTGPTPTPSITPGRRTAWCYGTPGIATALNHAGQVLNDPTLLHAATTALGHLAADLTAWDTEGPGLCHGAAGVLISARHSNAQLAARAVNTALSLSSATPGLLTGKAGAALALADYAQLLAHPRTAPWDAVLLAS
ncbi:lanthionine synthetase [Streptomyces sp. PT12]|nr:lanthionine synthetase [Streptomyces sp. PT12]